MSRVRSMRARSYRSVACGGRIARRWRRMIRFCPRAEQLRQQWPQAVGPDLVTLEGRMQLVDRHPVEERAVGARQSVVDVQVEDRLSVGELRESVVDAPNLRQHGGVVIP